MIWVHARIDNHHHTVMVVMRERETLEEAMGRGVACLLDQEGGDYARAVWSETANYYTVDPEPPLMDGQIPGAIVSRSGDRGVST